MSELSVAITLPTLGVPSRSGSAPGTAGCRQWRVSRFAVLAIYWTGRRRARTAHRRRARRSPQPDRRRGHRARRLHRGRRDGEARSCGDRPTDPHRRQLRGAIGRVVGVPQHIAEQLAAYRDAGAPTPARATTSRRGSSARHSPSTPVLNPPLTDSLVARSANCHRIGDAEAGYSRVAEMRARNIRRAAT